MTWTLGWTCLPSPVTLLRYSKMCPATPGIPPDSYVTFPWGTNCLCSILTWSACVALRLPAVLKCSLQLRSFSQTAVCTETTWTAVASCCLWHQLHIGWWPVWCLVYGMGRDSFLLPVFYKLWNTLPHISSRAYFVFTRNSWLQGVEGCLCSQYQTDYFYHPCRSSAGIATLFRSKILLMSSLNHVAVLENILEVKRWNAAVSRSFLQLVSLSPTALKESQHNCHRKDNKRTAVCARILMKFIGPLSTAILVLFTDS